MTEAVDPCLGHNFPETEASSILQIGLLWTQASAALRPSMAEVACMLSYPNLDIPIPTQPPFLNSARVVDLDSSTSSYSRNSFVSNDLKKIGVSYNSLGSPSTRSLNGPSRIEELDTKA